MLRKEFAELMKGNFYDAYRDYMVKNLYTREMFDATYNNLKTRKMINMIVNEFFKTVLEFYQKNPDGNFKMEKDFIEQNTYLKVLLGEYVEHTNDETLFEYLSCYAYSAEQLDPYMYDEEGKYHKERSRLAIEKNNNNTALMYKNVENDIRAGNYWWIFDNGTALRHQLVQQLILLNEKRIKHLLSIYFDREVTMEEFITNGELIEELDKNMKEKRGYVPYYVWNSTDTNGNMVTSTSKESPENGVYTYVVYKKENTIEGQQDRDESRNR